MVDIDSLTRALPVSQLEPNSVARLGGFVDVPRDQEWKVNVALLEPPAGQHELYLDPMEALEMILRRNGLAPETAISAASDLVRLMTADIPQQRRVTYFNTVDPNPSDCVPVSEFVGWLRRLGARSPGASQDLESRIPSDILDFFEQVAVVLRFVPVFKPSGSLDNPLSLVDLPSTPPPKAMLEFMPGAPFDGWGDLSDWRSSDTLFTRWRESMKPVAHSLEKVLGEPVYRFANPSYVDDEDDIHRFLVLHWCLSYQPESRFCQYVLRNSGARDIEELKAALLDPASYFQPFKMYESFPGLETTSSRVNYVPAGGKRPVTALFSDLEARDLAVDLLPREFGAKALFVGILGDD